MDGGIENVWMGVVIFLLSQQLYSLLNFNVFLN